MKNLKKQILIKNQELVELFDNKIIDVDTNKIALFVSFSFHLLAMTIVIGITSCFQPKVINVPNIIPIEILNVDEITRVPVNDEEEIKEDQEPKLWNFYAEFGGGIIQNNNVNAVSKSRTGRRRPFSMGATFKKFLTSAKGSL